MTRKRLLIFVAVAVGAFGQTQTTTPKTYQPITGRQRLQWFTLGTVGPQSLAGGLFSAGLATWVNAPREYGPHWEGFGKRYGMRLTGISTGNAMEAGVGALWGEDPRYPRAAGRPFKSRVGQIIKMTFLANSRNGRTMPAYSRYMAVTGNNFLSNTWREQSEADVQHALTRTAYGFLGRMGGNAFEEFWPDVKQKLFHRNRSKQ